MYEQSLVTKINQFASRLAAGAYDVPVWTRVQTKSAYKIVQVNSLTIAGDLVVLDLSNGVDATLTISLNELIDVVPLADRNKKTVFLKDFSNESGGLQTDADDERQAAFENLEELLEAVRSGR